MQPSERTYLQEQQLLAHLIGKLIAKSEDFKANSDPHWGHVGDVHSVNSHIMTALGMTTEELDESIQEIKATTDFKISRHKHYAEYSY